jgi:hypothetical protein
MPVLDFSGRVYGHLTVTGRVTSQPGRAILLCRCVCGVTLERTVSSLRTCPKASCGCQRRRIRKSRVGERYGRLVVQEMFPAVVAHNGPTCRCICDCGRETVVRSKDLPNGNTVSCGCRKKETFHALGRNGKLAYRGGHPRSARTRASDFDNYEGKLKCLNTSIALPIPSLF